MSRGPFEELASKELKKRDIEAAISSLSLREREALEVYTEGRSVAEVAEEMGIRPESLRVWMLSSSPKA